MAFFEKWRHSHTETGNFRHSVLNMISCGSILFYFQWEILNLASSLVKIEPKHAPFFRKVSKQRDTTIDIYFCVLARVLVHFSLVIVRRMKSIVLMINFLAVGLSVKTCEKTKNKMMYEFCWQFSFAYSGKLRDCMMQLTLCVHLT